MSGIAGTSAAWAGTTTVHPLGVLALLVCIIAMLKLPRSKALIPLLVLLVFIPSAQRVVILSIDFSFIRILILITIARIFVRNERRGIATTSPDRLILIWAGWSIFAYGALIGDISGVITRTGYMIEAVGAYYIGRTYIKNRYDIQQMIIVLGWISIIVAFLFLIERASGRNMFSIFGGVPEITLIRDGRLRCQGPFSHPIMAGVFWASILPWYVAFWFNKTIPRWKIMVFSIATLLIVLNTASSTPVMAILFSIIGLLLFKARKRMQLIRWISLATIFLLHLVMTKPVWHLLARIDVVSGSTGWHRYFLIDKAIENIDEWWLVGILSTRHWGRGLGDITNQFILEGVRSGLLGMILFILFLWSIFTLLGKRMKKTDSYNEIWFLWVAGVVLFMHIAGFFAVSYFGQLVAAFFLFLGATVSLAIANTKSK